MYSNKQIEFALKNIDKWSEQATQIFKDEIINVIQEEYKGFLETIKVYQTVLKYAREALCKGISELKVHCKYFDNTPEEDACIEMHEAVIEIDKVIGGKEDV